VGPGQAVELRVISKDGGIRSGFFDHGHLGDMASLGLQASQSEGTKGVYVTLNPLQPQTVNKAGCPNQVRPSRKGCSASAADVARRHWLFVDADPCRPANCSATNEEKARAWAKVVEVRAYLTGRGWPLPLVCDSGNGHHLLFRVDLPADDGGLVQRVLRALAARFSDAAVVIDTTVHDAARITKLYGSKACKGPDTPERPHRWTGIVDTPMTLAVVPRNLLEELAGVPPARRQPRPPFPTGPGAVSNFGIFLTEPKLALTRAYVARMPPAVQGQGGDKQTFAAACRLVIDFDLTPEEALPLLLEYNERCVPPWDEAGLRRKLEYADRQPGERGQLLRAAAQGHPGGEPARVPEPEPSTPPEAGGPFLASIPDFVLTDWRNARPQPRGRDEQGRLRRGRPRLLFGLPWLLHRELVRQQRATVHLPDVILAQTLWGDRTRWPRNWRQKVQGGLLRMVRYIHRDQTLGTDQLPLLRACPPRCPLHGRPDVPHRHFAVTVIRWIREQSDGQSELDFDYSFLGVLELFRFEEDGEEVFDFSQARGDSPAEVAARQGQIDEFKKSGRLCAVYLPALLFGRSPRSGLTYEHRYLLMALTREVTRTAKSEREDKAHVVVGGERDRGPYGIAACPYLEAGKRYVGFNGNGSRKRRHLRGRGYHLVGKTGRGWLWRAGCEVPEHKKGRWQAVRRFLTTLQQLPGAFGLVAGGWHPVEKKWRPLSELLALTRTPAGRAWLDACKLRLYAPEDYLLRWRGYFSDRLGLTHVPGGSDEGEPACGPDGGVPAVRVESAADLACWMARVGLTDRQLADRLEVSRSYVSGQRSGRRPWSKRFEAKVAAVVAGYEGQPPGETKG
jgi:hypothetical protein